MGGFEVLERRNPAEIERVLACAAVAGAWPLAAGDMREAVLDAHTLP